MLAGTAALSACGGGSHSGIPALNGTPGSPVASAPATFTFTFPKSTSSAGKRSPKYLSSATKSVTLQVTDTKNHGDHSDIYANVPTALKAVQIANFANLTGNPNVAGQCGTDPNNAGNYKCTATFQVPIGDDTMTLTSWDATGGTGNKLSQSISTQWAQQGVTNSFAISLDANAATITVSGTAACTSGGSVGTAYGSVGTSPATFTVAYTDAAGKTIVSPGQPALNVTTSGVTGGTLGVSVNQSAQTFTLTPSSSSVAGTVNVSATPANAGDGLTFNQTKSFTFSTGTAPGPSFLAVAEQITANSGQIALYYVALGGSGGADTFTAASPATLAVTNSVNESKPDVDTPQGLAFDSNGDLLVANAGNGTAGDRGNLACVPAGAIVTGANTATTTSDASVSIPEGIAYDARDGSVALSDTYGSSADFMSEYVLNGDYIAASTARDIARAAPYTGDTAVVGIPALTAGTYATAVTTGTNNANGGSSEIAIKNANGSETDIKSTTDSTIDDPVGLAWDNQNNQLAIVNNSYFPSPTGGSLDFYSVTGTPAKVKGINNPSSFCTCAWFNVAASPDGHIAASYNDLSADFRIQVYDNTAARNPVGGPIPFNGTTSSWGGNYIFDTGSYATGPSGAQKIYAMTWLSNTKLLVNLYSGASGKQGLYIFDISSLQVQPAFGYDDNSGSQYAAFPKETGFQATSLTPFASAYKP